MPEYGTDWFTFASSNECTLFGTYFKIMLPDDNQVKKMIEFTKCDRAVAEERQEDILHLGVAILAAFTYVPIHVPDKAEVFKYRVRLQNIFCIN